MSVDSACRVAVVMSWLDLSVSDVCSLTGRGVSKSQIHRILRGATVPSARERMLLSRAIAGALAERNDSSFWFSRCETAPRVPRVTPPRSPVASDLA